MCLGGDGALRRRLTFLTSGECRSSDAVSGSGIECECVSHSSVVTLR